MESREPSDSLSVYLGYQGFVVDHLRFEDETDREGRSRRVKIVEIQDRRKKHVCPRCGRRRPGAFRETQPVRLRECSIGDFVTYVEIRPYRVRCCGGTPVEALPIRAGRHRMTVRFFERLAALVRILPVLEVAGMAGLSWDTVAKVDKESTEFALGGSRPWIPPGLRAIGIDRENLEHRQKLELSRLLAMNRPLYKAYVLKEQLREILGYCWKDLTALRKRLRRWCNLMTWSKEPELKRIGKRIRESLERIVARYEHMELPMGLVEATNGIIANLRRQARGYRDVEYFKLKIYQRCSVESDPWREIIL